MSDWIRSIEMTQQAYELPGLEVCLDRLLYRIGPSFPSDSPHAFVYFLTIYNRSERTVTFLGRKWLIERADGETLVIEGDGIVGKTPRLQPGENFSYNSFHITDQNAVAHGSFHGFDSFDKPAFVRIPRIIMNIPKTQ